MILLVDFGNTRCKLALVDKQGTWVKVWEAPADISTFQKIEVDFLIKSGAFSSVVNLHADILEWFKIKNVLNIKSFSKLPFSINYQTPDTLGEDRLAAVTFACSEFRNIPLLIIQAGTCITYDYLGADAVYDGGAISLGLAMRFKALHTFTAKLPLLDPKPNVATIGTDTASSITSGAYWGMRFEVESRIKQFLEANPQGKCLLSGGDLTLFENSLKSPIFAVENMVLKGLYYLLKHNE